MRREVHISTTVYNHLFPRPGPSDPLNWNAHFSHNLVGEVRIETARFYGGLETVEAKYPGLNYTHPPHIKRLSYFPHHAKLFRTFAELGLTDSEILGLCRWEGTLWARQRFEKDEGRKVEDTTGNDIKMWRPKWERADQAEQPVALQPPPRRANVRQLSRPSQTTTTRTTANRISSSVTLPLQLQASMPAIQASILTHMGDDDDTETTAEPPMDSETQTPPLITTETFRRMQMLVAIRERGETISAMDPDFEQYLKDAAEDHGDNEALSNELGQRYQAFQAAHTITTVMNSVAQTQALAQAAARSGIEGTGAAGVHVLEVDAL